MRETWAYIEEFPQYMVSNWGHVLNTKTDRVLRPGAISNSGYAQAHLYVAGVRHARYIHRLVAEAFIGDVFELEVNHIDGDKLNNAVWNLEIVTPKQNSQHCYDTGLRVPPSMKQVRIVETGETFRSITDCANYLGRTVSTVSSAIHRGARTAGVHVEFVGEVV